MAAEPETLTSWTRTLNEEDALTLVDAAAPGTPVTDWAELGDRLLPQASLPRRKELLRIVRDELLDVRNGAIVDTAWMRLFRDGSPHRRLGLLYGRLWRNQPLVLRAVEELVHPALERTERPLPPHDADRIDAEAWDSFLRACLRVDIPNEAFEKTRTTLQSALRSVGVVVFSRTRQREVRVCRGRPDPLAFSWVLAREIAEGGERSEAWAIRDSFAARLFAPSAGYATTCVGAGVSAGLLRQGHLMGQMRLLTGPEMS